MTPVPSLAQSRRKLQTIPILPFLPPMWIPGVWNAMAFGDLGQVMWPQLPKTSVLKHL